MISNVLSYVEASALRYRDDVAYADSAEEITFGELQTAAKSAGSFLASRGIYGKPAVIFMNKAPRSLAAFFGALYAGCYYVPLDTDMPAQRIMLILDRLDDYVVIYDRYTAERLSDINDIHGEKFDYDELRSAPVDEERLARIRDRQIDTDPVYILFTSGSTGAPKGVCASHRSLIDYIENLSPILNVTHETVFGNQTPFYTDASLKELYQTVKCGAKTVIIDRECFSFPLKMIDFLNQYKINTICWAASAMSIISGLGTFEKAVPKYLRTVAFGSEVLPVKQYKRWKKALPSAIFLNLYGPTECTGVSCYYKVDREFSDDESIPIGRPFHNADVFLLDENGMRIPPSNVGVIGVIYIRGAGVTLGYYNDPVKTEGSFIQNPLNHNYREPVYNTGDLARYNERGELVYLGRADNQIKHLGYRIELADIECAAASCEGVLLVCALYDETKKQIRLCYSGEALRDDLYAHLTRKLPKYMLPALIIQYEELPRTSNGKVDRNGLKKSLLQKRTNDNEY